MVKHGPRSCRLRNERKSQHEALGQDGKKRKTKSSSPYHCTRRWRSRACSCLKETTMRARLAASQPAKNSTCSGERPRLSISNRAAAAMCRQSIASSGRWSRLKWEDTKKRRINTPYRLEALSLQAVRAERAAAHTPCQASREAARRRCVVFAVTRRKGGFSPFRPMYELRRRWADRCSSQKSGVEYHTLVVHAVSGAT